MVPQTVDELVETARFVTKSLNPDAPTDYGWVQMATPMVDSMWSWSSRLAAYGGSYLDDTNHPNFNNEAGLKAADTIFCSFSRLLPKTLANTASPAW